MTPLVLRTIRGMIWDTFRQSLSSKLFYGMIAMTLVAMLLCSSLEFRGDTRRSPDIHDTTGYITKSEAERLGAKKVAEDTVPILGGEVSLGFGLITLPLARPRDDAVKFIQLSLAAAVADTVGVLLALLWTAGFLPTFLEPSSATVLLAKPTPRWAILFGKYLGVTLFVAVQASLFIGGTWLTLGLKTGIWSGAYWYAVPLLTINFGIFYAVSTFFAVCTRSTIASAFGTLMVWLLCWTINYTYINVSVAPPRGLAPSSHVMLGTAYWVMPKPVDMGGIFYDAIRGEGFAMKAPELDFAQAAGSIHPELSVATSVLFALAMLLAAAYEFRQTDY